MGLQQHQHRRNSPETTTLEAPSILSSNAKWAILSIAVLLILQMSTEQRNLHTNSPIEVETRIAAATGVESLRSHNTFRDDDDENDGDSPDDTNSLKVHDTHSNHHKNSNFIRTTQTENENERLQVVPQENNNSTQQYTDEDFAAKSENSHQHDDSPSVAVITYGYLPANKPSVVDRFRLMVLEALDTWLANEPTIFYVVNEVFRPNLEELCSQNATMTEYCNRITPVYVNCSEGYRGKAPNCKMDQGMSYMAREYPNYDWYIYQDDDMYIRIDYFKSFVSGLQDYISEPVMLHAKPLQHLAYNKNCTDLDPENWTYPWGQPAVYSRGALQLLRRGFELGGVQAQGTEFDETHDVANAIFHFMYQLPAIKLPLIHRNTNKEFQENLLGLHAVARPTFLHNPEVHLKFANISYPPPPYNYEWHRPRGFLQTETYQLYGSPSSWNETWHVMPIRDCQPPHPKQLTSNHSSGIETAAVET